ncbi:MAG: SDR family NAD(P)-dependent oxidoreductase [Phormidesmis sp. RL_2_1]|nr:SDR family NAD(P)-dependent oxidoreductase [Phormidesmis sp. RL_2_1]
MTVIQKTVIQKAVIGKTVVLTGASRGIGLEISRCFAQQGANLIGIARSHARLESWASEMAQWGIQAQGIAFDLTQIDRLCELSSQIEQCAQSISGNAQIDILINNAGIEIYRAFRDYDPQEIEQIVQVNLLAPMALTQRLLPIFSVNGHIVNIASLAGKKGHPYDSAYAASKAGLLMWSHSLRQEMAVSKTTGSKTVGSKTVGSKTAGSKTADSQVAQAQTAVSVICPGYVTDLGMLRDTGIEAPLLAGRSRAQDVAYAVLKAVVHKRSEVIVNQNYPLAVATRLQLAIEQLFPSLGDFSNRLLGITRLNQQRIKPAEHSIYPHANH